jgi:formate hydrogenlyase transcriptional activator
MENVQNLKKTHPISFNGISPEDKSSVLLKLSKDIAAVRDQADLSDLLKNKLGSVLSFEEITISISDQQKNISSVYLHIGKKNSGLPPDMPAPENPVIYTIEELSKISPVPAYISFYQKTTVKEIIAIGLRGRDITFGGLYIFSYKTELSLQKSKEMIQGIAAQLSIAVANIIANEKINKKEKENAVLLSLSNAIATIRNKTDLFNVIEEKLKKLFRFEHFVICLINDDKKTHSPFLYNQTESFIKNPGIAPVSTKKYTLDDGLCHIMMSTDTPVVFNVEDVLKWPVPPVWLMFWHNLGIREMIGLPIWDRNECVGFFYLYAKEINAISNEYYNLLHSISLQISVAVSNIKANEKIEEQLQEIKNYKQQLEEEKSYLREQVERNYNYSEIIGQGPGIKKVFHLIELVAASDSTVLLQGETGTGKELIARAIHTLSPRKDKLMIKVNCAALPANLVESELFGHEKGSFTGATDRRVGKFELAHNSTLFLDEIGELPLDIQVKLLRAIQEKEIERVGGKSIIKTNVRIIAATNRTLAKEVENGKFRSDLFYRLNVFPITIPPLRERKEDIAELSMHFIRKFAKKTGKELKKLSRGVLSSLIAYPWPGNVRELEHLMERSVLLSKGNLIKEIHLPKADHLQSDNNNLKTNIKTIFDNERDHIFHILQLCKGKISGKGGAAEILGVPATTLNSKIKKFKIKRKHTIS